MANYEVVDYGVRLRSANRLRNGSMRYSQLNWRLKLLALTLFAGFMAVVAMVAHWLIYDALPVWLASSLGLVGIGFALGTFVGEYMVKREQRLLVEDRSDARTSADM